MCQLLRKCTFEYYAFVISLNPNKEIMFFAGGMRSSVVLIGILLAAIIYVFYETSYQSMKSRSSSHRQQGFVNLLTTRFDFKNKPLEDLSYTSFNKSNDTQVFIRAVQTYASNGLIVIASFVFTYAAMALNLFLTSYKRFNITNHLFVASDSLGCGKIEPYGAHCIQYLNMKKAKAPSIYNSRDYNIKACVKPRIILECLNTGLDVLLVDLDIVFLKNPLSYFQYCQDCDLITQYDSAGKQINSGFFLVRNTRRAIHLFEQVVKMIPSKPVGDQVYMNRAARKLGKKIKIYSR